VSIAPSTHVAREIRAVLQIPEVLQIQEGRQIREGLEALPGQGPADGLSVGKMETLRLVTLPKMCGETGGD
jgi:hypothetical protein